MCHYHACYAIAIYSDPYEYTHLGHVGDLQGGSSIHAIAHQAKVQQAGSLAAHHFQLHLGVGVILHAETKQRGRGEG